MTELQLQARAALDAFGVQAISCVDVHGSGHIHATFRVATGGRTTHVLQRLNQTVFPDPFRVITNSAEVAGHVNARAAGFVPGPLPALDGKPWHVDADGSVWRLLPWLPHSRTYNITPGGAVARGAGRAFGRFHALTADCAVTFAPAIDGFLSLPARLAALEAAVAADRCGRLSEPAAALLVDAVDQRGARIVVAVADDHRLVHADCKVNNVLFDDADQPLAVVDLDTVMAGPRALDFGDLVRSATATMAEDAPDVGAVGFSRAAFEALADGYLDAAITVLDADEIDALVDGAVYMSFMLGVRFLTDYLGGDTYFVPVRPAQNLDRARAQLRLAELFLLARGELQQVVGQLARERLTQERLSQERLTQERLTQERKGR